MMLQLMLTGKLGLNGILAMLLVVGVLRGVRDPVKRENTEDPAVLDQVMKTENVTHIIVQVRLHPYT